MKTNLRAFLMTVLIILSGIGYTLPVQAAATVTLQVNAADNNAVEDGTSFDTTPSPLWIGNGASTASSFTGIRFTNVSIPAGATITSANLSLYSSQSQWITVSFSIAAEAAANSAVFSSTSKMSQRALTSMKVQHNDNVQWNANTWYNLDEIAPVIQEVVNQPGWQSGNSLSIIVQGTGSAYARKLAASFNGSAVNAPKLTVTYDAAAQTPTATGLPGPTSTATAVQTTLPAPTSTQTRTPTQPILPTSTSTPSFTPTPLSTLPATSTPTQTATPGQVSMAAFPVGLGGTDVNSHMILRTVDDRVYIVAFNSQYTKSVNLYWTTSPGIPTASTAFNGSLTFQDTADIISVDAVYDGGSMIHILTNNQSSQIKDWPFNISTNTLKAPKTLAVDGGQFPNGGAGYTGTEGIVGMFDRSGKLHAAYWSSSDHIVYTAYTYDAVSDGLTQVGSPAQVDSSGNASHPALGVSPVDGSVSIAWISHTNPAQILTRSKSAAGIWGNVLVASTAPVWTSRYFGIDIDQGPSLVIDQNNLQQLTYIENYDASGEYGRIHYAANPGTGWVDQALPWYTHDPALQLSSNGDVTIFGHGHPKNVSGPCLSIDDMCFIKKTAGGSWQSPQLLIQHTGTNSFDTSPSSKWSVVGWNRPETLELVFSMVANGDYSHPTVYYAQIGPGGSPTPTPISTSTRTATPVSSATSTPLPTATGTLLPSATPTPLPSSTPTRTPTQTPTLTATATRTPTPAAAVLLLGSASVGSSQDNNPGGLAEAFIYTASATGLANNLSIYIDSNNAATQVLVGLYGNTAGNTPGSLLSSGVINNPVKGAWNSVNVTGASVTAGTKYWIAVLSPNGKGTVRFRNVSSGSGAQVSAQSNLTALPASWSPGRSYKQSLLSAYAQQVP